MNEQELTIHWMKMNEWFIELTSFYKCYNDFINVIIIW